MFGITEKYSQHLRCDYFIESGMFAPPCIFNSSRFLIPLVLGPMTAIPPTDSFFNSRRCSTRPTQVKQMTHNILTHRPQFHHQPSQPSCNAHNAAHSPVNTNTKKRHADSIVDGIDESLNEHALADICPPPAIPDWGPLFREWLQARRRWARDRGFSDPVLLGLLLSGAFNTWLQPQWPLLYNQDLRGPTEGASRWIRLFDFWLLMPCTQELLVIQQPLYPTVQAPTNPTNTTMVPAPIPSGPGPNPRIPTRGNRRDTRNATSLRTVVAIQQECEKRGGEAAAIQRLEVVFPANTVVSRDALKVTRRSTRRSRGSTRNHQGYLEFAGRREGQHYCRLCGLASKLWKNEKDLLNHVWNVHCDY